MNRKILGVLGAVVLAAASLLSGSGWPPFMPARADVPYGHNNGSLTANSQCIQINPVAGASSATVSLTGTHSLVITVKGLTADGASETITSISGAATLTSNGIYHYLLYTYKIVEACTTSYTSGSGVVDLSSSASTAYVSANSGGGGGTQNVAIVSPNPLNVNAVNTPAPTALPTGAGYPTPAALPDLQAYLKCVGASPNPGPSPGYAGVCSFDTKGAIYTSVDNFPLPGPTDGSGNPIVTISSGSTVTVGGLRVPEATPTPTAMPSELPAAAVHYAYTGSGVLEADISCIETTPVVLTISSSTDTPVIEGAGSGALRIALCGSEGSSTGTGTGYLELSTSATCASGFTAIERNFSFTANGGFEHHMQWAYYRLPAGDSLCYHSVWTSGVQSITVYATGPF